MVADCLWGLQRRVEVNENKKSYVCTFRNKCSLISRKINMSPCLYLYLLLTKDGCLCDLQRGPGIIKNREIVYVC